MRSAAPPGQTLPEYVLIVTLVVGALLAPVIDERSAVAYLHDALIGAWQAFRELVLRL